MTYGTIAAGAVLGVAFTGFVFTVGEVAGTWEAQAGFSEIRKQRDQALEDLRQCRYEANRFRELFKQWNQIAVDERSRGQRWSQVALRFEEASSKNEASAKKAIDLIRQCQGGK
jgi:hypothetical protein